MPRILFLCTGNSCRSQMAEGWARQIWGDRLKALSAGTKPHRLDPRAVTVMAESGVDISHHRPKSLAEIGDEPVDYVITVCDRARETCPVFPARVKRVHAGFADPPRLARDAGTEPERLAAYRTVRDQIRRFVERLADVLPRGALD